MKTKMKYAAIAIEVLTFSVFIFSCSRNKEGNNEVKKLPNTVILEWNEIAFKAFDGPYYQHSLMASRINAMTHLAMHNAINAVEPVYATYGFTVKDVMNWRCWF